jgi:outer membrane receptor protein involved in Fe transport
MSDIRLALALGCLAVVWSSASSGAQVASRDSVERRDSNVVTLAPLSVRASILPHTTVRSSVPARVAILGNDVVNSWKPRLVADALARAPGISTYDDLGTPWKLTLSSRGFSVGPTVGLPPGLSVFVDGVRQNEPDAQEVNFDLLPTDHIDHIEILNGSASLLGSNSLGGAINLVTSRGTGPTAGSVELTGGSFGDAAVDATVSGGGSSGLSYYAGGGYGHERGWRDATAARNGNLFINVGHQWSDRGFNFQAFASRSRAETAGSLPESIFREAPRTNFTPGDFENLEVRQVALRGHLGAGSDLAGTIYIRHSSGERFNVNQAPDPDVRSRNRGLVLGATGDWRRNRDFARGALSWRIGFDGAVSDVRVRIFNESADEPVELTTDVTSRSLDVAPHALVEYRRGHVTLSGAGRYDFLRIPFHSRLSPDDAVHDYHSVSPSLGATIELGRGTLVYASVGRAFRAPTIIELGCADADASCPLPFALGDDPPLSPVRSTTREAGTRWNRPGMALTASVFRTDVHDEIFFIASDNALLSGYFTNLAHTRRAGVELAMNGTLPKSFGTWYVNATRTRATFESDAEVFSIRSDDDFRDSPYAGDNAVRPGRSLPLVPRDRLNAGADARILGFAAGAAVRYVGKQWLRGDDSNSTRPLGGYAALDLRAAREFGPVNISAILINAFDTHAAIFGTFNVNRRTGELERFLTPMNARSVKLVVRRDFR